MKKVISALITSLLMLVSVAKAEDLKEGVSYQFSLGGQTLGVRLLGLKDGAAVIQISDNGQPSSLARSKLVQRRSSDLNSELRQER